MHTWAFKDTAEQGFERAGRRLIPCMSS